MNPDTNKLEGKRYVRKLKKFIIMASWLKVGMWDT